MGDAVTYTHCRSCGRRVTGQLALADGLCGDSVDNDAEEPRQCALAFADFARAHDVGVDERYPIDFTRPEIQVVFDQWMETR